MPALKLALRRTIASSAVNPPSILSPPGSRRVYGGVRMRSTLAKGCARLRVGGGGGGAHVKGGVSVTTTIKQVMMCCFNSKTRVFMLSSSSSSSSSFQERETSKKTDTFIRVSPSSSSSSSSSPLLSSSSDNYNNKNNNNNNKKNNNSNYIVAEMGDEDKQNDVVWHQNGDVVSRQDEDQKQEKSSKLLTLPTLLTLARVASIPVFIATFYVNSWWGATATTSIFVAAAITDWLDGYLARRMRLGTAFGAFLDPVADKLMVAATLVLLCSRPPEIALFGDIPWLFPVPAIAIIGREITMSAVREWAASQDAKLLQAVAVNNLGKWKTATQMTALIIILATRDSSISSQGALAASGVGLLYVSAGLAAWSLVVYMSKIWKVLMR